MSSSTRERSTSEVSATKDPKLVEVQIPSFEKATDETSGKTYYKYNIVTVSKDPVKKWEISRRFCNFYDLFSSISETRSLNVKFPVPSLLQFSTSPYDLASSRIKKLEAFLNELVHLSDLTEFESSLLYAFLDVGDHLNRSGDHLNRNGLGRAHSDSGTMSPPLAFGDMSDGSSSGLEDEDGLLVGDSVEPCVTTDSEIVSTMNTRRPSALNYIDIDDIEEAAYVPDAYIGSSEGQVNGIWAREHSNGHGEVAAGHGHDHRSSTTSSTKASEAGTSSNSFMWALGIFTMGGIAAFIVLKAQKT